MDKKLGFLAFIVPFAVYILTLNGIWSSDYQASILGFQYALWEKHAISLGIQGNPIVQSVDVGLFKGKYYSEISPGFGILALPFAALGFFLDGGTTLNLWGSGLILDELFLALNSAVACYVVYKICRLYADPQSSFLASLSLALGTSLWPISTMIFIQGSSLLFSTSAVYLVLKYTKKMSEGRNQSKVSVSKDLVLAGLLLGIASFIEYAAALFVFPLVAFLIWKSKQRGDKTIEPIKTNGKKILRTPTVILLPSLICFLITFSFGPSMELIYNTLAFGNPLIFPESLKATGVSLVSLVEEFNLKSMAGHVAFYLISPYRGLFFFSPLLILGIYGLYHMSKSKQQRDVSLLFVSLFLLVLLFYSAWRDWAGGLAYGPRFLILGLPYIAIPISTVLSNNSGRMRAIFLSLFVTSSLIEGIGSLTTALSVAGNFFPYQPLALNFPWFLQGKLDSWWYSKIGQNALEGQLFGILLLLAIWFTAGYFVFQDRTTLRGCMESLS